MPIKIPRIACLIAALLSFHCSCAGSSTLSAFAPRTNFTANAMDETHEENFTIPPTEKKDTVSDKAGQVILGVALVGVIIGSAILIPLIVTHKL